jgi:glycosyl hydrolase family 20
VNANLSEPIVAFHIDMNMAQFNENYLIKWLKSLAEFGYNTILWEVENNIEWEICPDANSPDAFSKSEFREILNTSEELGFCNIPLLQTFGHAQYVLKHQKYAYLRELPEEISQYCPSNPKLIPFLKRWIDEYLELFSNCKVFHLGADEARFLGSCQKCADKVEQTSVSELYINHIEQVSYYLSAKGVRPAIWGDMILAHPEALNKLSRDIMIFDWNYRHHSQSESIRMWGRGDISKSELTADETEYWGKFLFPEGVDKPWNVYFSADFLINKGFNVVTCSTSSSCGDTVFAPNESMHLPNVFDYSKKGLKSAKGTVMTSWTTHLHPWEMQLAAIRIPDYVRNFPDGTLEEYKHWFVMETFGSDNPDFFTAVALLEQYCFLGRSGHRGFGKDCLPIAYENIQKYAISELRDQDKLVAEHNKTLGLLEDYRAGTAMMVKFKQKCLYNHKIIDCWIRAGELLITNAQVAAAILSREQGGNPDCKQLITKLAEQKQMMYAFYLQQQRPVRAKQIAEYLFDALINELEKMIENKNAA